MLTNRCVSSGDWSTWLWVAPDRHPWWFGGVLIQVQALDLASCASTATLRWIQLDKDKDRDKRRSVKTLLLNPEPRLEETAHPCRGAATAQQDGVLASRTPTTEANMVGSCIRLTSLEGLWFALLCYLAVTVVARFLFVLDIGVGYFRIFLYSNIIFAVKALPLFDRCIRSAWYCCSRCSYCCGSDKPFKV